MKNNRHSEQGQAIIELVMLLFGFTIVFLGLVFISGLSDADLYAFTQARNDAELTASDTREGTPPRLAEFGVVKRFKPDIYKDSDYLDFSPMDRTGYVQGNTIGSFPSAFTNGAVSEPGKFSNDYFVQAKLEEWKDMRNADTQVFKADFVTGLANLNARGAADLVAGRAKNINNVTTLNSLHHRAGTVNALYRTFQRLFGVRITPRMLEDAPGNVVYMPVFSE